MSDTVKNIFVIFACIMCAVIGYLMLAQDPGEAGGSVSIERREELLNKTQAFIARRSQLDQIQIDQSLFKDTVFVSLRSFSTEVPNQPIGRESIFGSIQPIEAAAAAVTERDSEVDEQ